MLTKLLPVMLVRRTAALAGPYVLGIAAGLVLQEYVSLPFRNPWDVIGPLTMLRYNPWTNVVRFAVVVAAPLACLAVVATLSSAFRRHVLSRVSESDAPPVTGRAAAQTKSLAWVWSAVIVAIALTVSLNRSARIFELDVFHEGESLGAAVSWQAGNAPYSGIVFAHGVFQDPYRSVLAFRLFGRSIGAVRTLESMQKIAAYLLLAVLLMRVFPLGMAACAAVGVMAVGLASRSIEIQTRDLTTMVFLLSFVGLHRSTGFVRRASRWRAICSCLLAVSVLGAFADSVDRGLFLLVGYALLAPFAYVALGDDRRERRRFLVGAGAGVVAGLVLLRLALRGPFGPFVDYVFLSMPRYWELMDGYVFPLLEPAFLAATLLVAFNTYWLALSIASVAMEERKGIVGRLFDRYGLEAGLWVISLCVFRSALGRADLPHLTPSLWPTLLLSLRIGWREGRRAWVPSRVRHAVLSLSCAAGVLIAAGGGWRVFQSDLVTRNFPWRVPDSRFIPSSYVATIEFLRRTVKPGDQFFAFNNEAIWYYFLDRPSPSRFYVPWFAVPSQYQRELVGDLEAARVTYVLYHNESMGSSLDGISNERRLPVVSKYLREHFQFLTRLDGNEIWVRRIPPLA